jgi:hypothetical protein
MSTARDLAGTRPLIAPKGSGTPRPITDFNYLHRLIISLLNQTAAAYICAAEEARPALNRLIKANGLFMTKQRIAENDRLLAWPITPVHQPKHPFEYNPVLIFLFAYIPDHCFAINTSTPSLMFISFISLVRFASRFSVSAPNVSALQPKNHLGDTSCLLVKTALLNGSTMKKASASLPLLMEVKTCSFIIVRSKAQASKA